MTEVKHLNLEILPDHLPEDMIPQLENGLELISESKLNIPMVWLFRSYAWGDFIRSENIDENGRVSIYPPKEKIQQLSSELALEKKEKQEALKREQILLQKFKDAGIDVK